MDIQDISAVARRFGCICGESCYDPKYDINYDCVIDIRDISGVARHFGETDP